MNVRYKYLTVTFGKLNTNEILWDGSKMQKHVFFWWLECNRRNNSQRQTAKEDVQLYDKENDCLQWGNTTVFPLCFSNFL